MSSTCDSVAEKIFFPFELPIGKVPKDFMAMKDAVADLMAHAKDTVGYGYQLELETRKTRAYGEQSLPRRIWIETEADYLKLLKKEKAFSRFKSDISLIHSELPALTQWTYQHPLQVVEHSGRWPELLKVCAYFVANPQPNLYIRELPIAVHTKFVEQNKTVLRSLLTALLPAEQIVAVEAGQKPVFEQMFSLKYPESLIRLRLLDPALKQQYGFPVSDLSVVVSEFNQLELGMPTCFITENLLPFLTLPPMANSIAILGGGYALNRLKHADWLSRCPIVYWGDMDADGFNILSQLRGHFPHTQSVMMEPETYRRFEAFSVEVERKMDMEPLLLTVEERSLYDYLTEYKRRLEQERISQPYVNQVLRRLS